MVCKLEEALHSYDPNFSRCQSRALLCSLKGLAFRMDNGMYWSSMPAGIRGKDYRDYTGSFQVCQADGGKVKIIDYKDNVLGVDTSDVRNTTKAAKGNKAYLFEFQLVYHKDKVAFRSTNGKFVCRIYYTKDMTSLEAVKDIADDNCLFERVGAEL
ncbi:hypothetical protein NDU88_001211 [Pleurodeles waltl]|uniref:Uncharacterized protein n=1 Tax=Pleurodeles waltl TaxID=8319 RepID=A0AAV7Q6D9_PLEWA|nr:hypothetical protein NDU88_001211 [Pleurodeles waltl]